MEWYAICQNNNKLIYTNVIREDIIEDVKKAIKKNNTYEEIKETVRKDLMYHYWSKVEYEVMISNVLSGGLCKKIDVWYQLEPNLDLIVKNLIRELAPWKYKKILKGENNE